MKFYEGEFSELSRRALCHFQKGLSSVEVVKDGNLQRVHFKNAYENVWRSELRETIKWNVDRSSPTNKLRNFIDWLDEVGGELRYQRKMRRFKMLFSTW